MLLLQQLFLALVVVTMIGCATQQQAPERAKGRVITYRGREMFQSPPPTHVLGAIAVDDGSWCGARIFAYENQRFSTLDEFKTFIRSLPPGSIVAWDSGCIRFDTIPLPRSNMSMKEFKDFCQQSKIEFRYICGW